MKNTTNNHAYNPEYDEALTLVETHNAEAEAEAINEFNQTTMELFDSDGTYMIGVLTSKTNELKRGHSVYPLKDNQTEALIKLLSTESYTPTDDDWVIDEEKDIYDLKLTADDYIERGYSSWIPTDACIIQDTIVKKLRIYATAGAALAKLIGSRSIDNWAVIIDIMQQLVGKNRIFTPPSENICKKIIDNERIAADRLRLDMIIADIKPFKTKKPARKSHRKASR